MKAIRQKLKRFRDERALVSFWRDGFDDRRMQGFVLDFSVDLVLIQHIYDFHVDGNLLLRIADITDVQATATDAFQKQLLVEEGGLEEIDFGMKPPLSTYDVFLRSLPEGEIVILEDEVADAPEFIIGTLVAADEVEVLVRYFTGAARWIDELSVMEIDKITSCQTGTHYIRYYARHFSRNGGH